MAFRCFAALPAVVCALGLAAQEAPHAFVGARIKSPCEYLVGVTRELEIVPPQALLGRFREVGNSLGQDLLNPPNVAGWPGYAPDQYRAWITTGSVPERRAEVMGVADRVRFAQANAEELASTFAGEQFDLVYSFGVIHHTPHPDRALAQMRQLAAPGATLKLMVYHRHSWKVFWILATQERGRFWKADERIAKHAEAELGCPVAFTYTRREGRALVERAGLFALEQGNFFTSLVPLRLAQVLRERLGPPSADSSQIAAWNGSAALGRVIEAVLTADGRVGLWLARTGLRLPGLSTYAVCRTSA